MSESDETMSNNNAGYTVNIKYLHSLNAQLQITEAVRFLNFISIK